MRRMKHHLHSNVLDKRALETRETEQRTKKQNSLLREFKVVFRPKLRLRSIKVHFREVHSAA